MLIRSALIPQLCPFKDAIETAVRELAERTKINIHLFKVYLLTEFAYS